LVGNSVLLLAHHKNEEMNIKTLQIRVIGSVQGVFFRDYTRRTAQKLEITGWVKNCPDGSVELLASGTIEQLDTLISWLHQGSPNAVVQKVITKEISPEKTYRFFDITF